MAFLIMKNTYPKWFLLSFLSVFLFVSSISAQTADKIDDFVKSEMQKQHIPGVSLAIIKNGKIAKVKGYGLANVETNVPVTTETVFKIGSISKPIIAMGIMLLVEEGKISLDDKVSKYLEGTPESWKDITIRNLLSHTSGIIREAPGFNPFKIQPDIDVIKTAYPLPLNFTPGEKYEYCNVGYFSLAEIIRQVSGKSWSEFLTERIFKPLGMSSTRTTTFDDIVPHRANAYSFTGNKLKNAEVYTAVRPSGAFLSTILDLAKLEAALNGTSFLKPESRKLMWTPFKFNDGKNSIYGLGWRIDEVNGRKRIGHGGTLNGFKSHFARFVDDGVTVIVLTNLEQVDSSEFSSKIAGLYIPSRAAKSPKM
ncbi:MAG TPA: serine hydrolase domain-containing protein [Pyrinomonadaceae bacterium]